MTKTRIYLVEDHSLIRRGLSGLINTEADMEICGEADNSATATKEISATIPDLVIVDISLKGSNGLELIKNLKALNKSIPILVLSMHDENLYALRVLKAGALGYVMKQENISKVIEAIRRVRKGQLYVSDKVSHQMLNHITGNDSSQSISPVSALTDRELEIVELIGGGLPTREISARLHISVKTVETHKAHIKEKLNIANGAKLVQFCVSWVDEKRRGTVE